MRFLQKHWFPLGLGCVFLVASGLRFWGLSRFPDLVFDEIYFAKFAANYLHSVPFFDNHPPLGKCLIALGMALSRIFTALVPGSDRPITSVEGFQWVTWGYRWLNALVGSVLPLVGAALIYELSHRRSMALLAAILMAADGLLLVESRYALINMYIMAFGLLAQWAFLRAVRLWGRQQATQGVATEIPSPPPPHQSFGPGAWWAIGGIFCGAALAVKWNGLGFLLGLYGSLGFSWICGWLGIDAKTSPAGDRLPPWRILPQIPLGDWFWGFMVLPFVVYRLAWIPHLSINPAYDFWESQSQGLHSHAQVGSGQETHPYCSLWWSWPLLLRPVAYWYKTFDQGGKTWVYDVHAQGNPMLWWISLGAVIFAVIILGELVGRTVGAWEGWRTRSQINPLDVPLLDGVDHSAKNPPLYFSDSLADPLPENSPRDFPDNLFNNSSPDSSHSFPHGSSQNPPEDLDQLMDDSRSNFLSHSPGNLSGSLSGNAAASSGGNFGGNFGGNPGGNSGGNSGGNPVTNPMGHSLNFLPSSANNSHPNSSHDSPLNLSQQLENLKVLPQDFWILGYLLINYAAHWLPWIGVSRCLFLYHHMASSIYGFFLLAWLLDRWLRCDRGLWRVFAWVTLGLIIWGLWYWLPIFVGFPLEESAFRSRMWFRSWY